MMKKKNLWFLTLFSLVLVLSVYYVTMPNDLLAVSSTTSGSKGSDKNSEEEVVSTTETDSIEALKVEDDTKTKDTLNELQKKLTNSDTSVEEKNKAYEEIKDLNNNSGLEDNLEASIKSQYKCNAFTKIEDNTVKVVVDNCDNSKSLANNIMRLVQEQFDKKMYISVQFS